MPNRPSRRTLVRWNDDHDKELLLWICYCCTEAGIKIPFARVAQCMGASFTEGACIQHLAKIRNKMEEAGLHVPPTQKRGTVTRTGSSIYRPKVKEVNAPVPRVRPDIPPPQRTFNLYGDDEEEEEEEENVEHPETNATSKVSKPNKVTRRQARTNQASAVKHDPSEDDELPLVLDGDNEYGAKRSNVSPQSTQMKLHFNQQSKTMPATQGHGSANIHSIQPIQKSPTIKYESAEDYNRSNTAQQNPPQARTNRRKSGAMAGEDNDDDDEYEPSNKGRSRSKKKPTHAAKKQKVNDKKKGATDKVADAVMSNGYAGLTTQNADRAAMPPPSLPAHNTNFDFGWNPDFINQPFSSISDHHNLAYRGMDDGTSHSAWTDPSTNSFDNFDFTQGAGVDDPMFNAYPNVPFQRHFGNMAVSTSAPPTRNASYASATSNSTVESQPASWNQPTRSPGFPNPQEATRVLHKMLNTPGADASTHINIFGDTLQNRSLGSGFDHDMSSTAFKQTGTHQNQATSNDNGSLFVGTPELPDTEINFSDYLHD